MVKKLGVLKEGHTKNNKFSDLTSIVSILETALQIVFLYFIPH
jgi:hypothetical protein